MKSRWLRMLIALDQFFAVLLLDTSEDETISSWVGRNKAGKWQEKVLDWIFGKGHCQESIEWDEVKDVTG